MYTSTKKKPSIVVEEYNGGGQKYKKKYESNRRHAKKSDEQTDMDTLLREQRGKEKQFFRQWKEKNRDNKKKIRSIMRNQSRDFHTRERESFTRNEAPYGMVIHDETYYIFKHDGCNPECKADNCISWLLESELN